MSGPDTEGASAALARRHCGVDGLERQILVDQTNRSVVVGERVIVKWFTPPTPAPHPGIQVLEHLRGVGFERMPPFLGCEKSGGLVVAMISGFIKGALDGWDWFVDGFTGWADGDVSSGTVIGDAGDIGRLGAELHLALATPSSVFAQPLGRVPVGGERARCERLLSEARKEVGADVQPIIDRVTVQIAETFAAIPDDDVTGIVLHGDLHVGQMLRADNVIRVTDFDGNPMLDASDRLRRRPAAVDVASLVQSIDHAGRIANKRRPDADLEPLIAETSASALAAYRSGLGARVDLLNDSLLWAFRIAQELHELVYAARHLPRWSYAPAATLASMFPDDN